jgi:hypothetical protein
VEHPIAPPPEFGGTVSVVIGAGGGIGGAIADHWRRLRPVVGSTAGCAALCQALP